MFQTDHASSFPSHQFIIAGQSPYAFGSPSNSTYWGCDAPPGTTVNGIDANGNGTPNVFPCFDYNTIGDLLDRAGHSWRVYTPEIGLPDGLLDGFDAIRHIRYGPDWNATYDTPETNVLTDIPAGKLADFTYVYPQDENSDHAEGGTATGPAWVASIVNAIGESQFYANTAIFVTWDDWGGWYDHVPPQQLDAYGLGFRVPLMVISPYAKRGYVSHVQHEFGSILKFTEETFGLGSLGTADARADDLSDCFDFTQTPGTYTPVATKYRAAYFIAHAHDLDRPDY
jgi:phospholipase C